MTIEEMDEAYSNLKNEYFDIQDKHTTARQFIDCYKKDIFKLQKQLKIAVEQLKDTYVICFRNKDSLLHTPEHNIIGGIERDCAIALQQIKELEK